MAPANTHNFFITDSPNKTSHLHPWRPWGHGPLQVRWNLVHAQIQAQLVRVFVKKNLHRRHVKKGDLSFQIACALSRRFWTKPKATWRRIGPRKAGPNGMWTGMRLWRSRTQSASKSLTTVCNPTWPPNPRSKRTRQLSKPLS